MWLGIWFLVALALRLGYLPTQTHPGFDEAFYLQIAERFASGDGLTSQHLFTLADPQPLPTRRIWKPPGYPVLLGTWMRVAGRSYRAAQVSSALIGALVVVPIGLLGARFATPRAGLAAGATAALHPRLIEVSAVTLADMPLILGITLGLLGVATARRAGRARWAVLGGLAWGCALTIKSTALVPAAVGLVYAAWPRPGTRRLNGRLLAATAAGFALPALLLAAYNTRTYGHASGGPQGVVNLAQEWLDREALYFTPGMAEEAARVMDTVPLRVWLAQAAYNIWDYVRLAPSVFHPLLLAAALGGGWVAWRAPPHRTGPVFWTVLAYFATCGARAHPEGRYLLPAVAFACIWAGILTDAAVARWAPHRVTLAGAVLALGFGAGTRVGTRPLLPAPRDASFADVGALIRADYGAAQRPVVMARSNLFAFFADAYHVGLPVGGPEVVARVVRRWHAGYVVLDSRTVAVRRHALLPWYDAPPVWLRPVGQVRAGEFPVVLYRVDPPRVPAAPPPEASEVGEPAAKAATAARSTTR